MPKIAKEIVDAVKAKTPPGEKSLVNDIAALFEGPLGQYSLSTNRLMMHSGATLNSADIANLSNNLLNAIQHAKRDEKDALTKFIKVLSSQRLIHHKTSYGVISDATAADSQLSDSDCQLIASEFLKITKHYALTSSDSQNSTPSPTQSAPRQSTAWVGSKSNTPVSQSTGSSPNKSPANSDNEADLESTVIKPANSIEEAVFKNIYDKISKSGINNAKVLYGDTLGQFIISFPNKTSEEQQRYAEYAIMAYIIEHTGEVPEKSIERFKNTPPLAEFKNIDFEPLQNAIQHHKALQKMSRPTVAAAGNQQVVSKRLKKERNTQKPNDDADPTISRSGDRAARRSRRTRATTKTKKQVTTDSTITASSTPDTDTTRQTAIQAAMNEYMSRSNDFSQHVSKAEYAAAAQAASDAAGLLRHLHGLYMADNNTYSASWAILNAKILDARKEYATYLNHLSHIARLQNDIQNINPSAAPAEQQKAIDRNKFLNSKIADLQSDAENIINSANHALQLAKDELHSQQSSIPSSSVNGMPSYGDYENDIDDMENEIREHDKDRGINMRERIAQLEALFNKKAAAASAAPDKPKPGKVKIPAGLEATIARTHTATKKFYDTDLIIKEINDISAKLTSIENNNTAKKLELQTELDTIIAQRKSFTDNILLHRQLGPVGILDAAINEAKSSPIPTDDAKREARDSKIELLEKAKNDYNEQDNRIKAMQGNINLMPDPVIEEKKAEDDKSVITSSAADDKSAESKKSRPDNVAFFGDIYIIGKSGLMQREYDKIATPSELPLPADEKKEDDDDVLLKLESSIETKEHREKSKDSVLAFKAGKTQRTSPWFDETEFRMTILKFQDVDNLDGRFPFGSDPRAIFTEHTQTNPKTKAQHVVSILRQLPDNLNPKRIDAHKVFMDFIEADHTKKKVDANKNMSVSAYTTYSAELNTEKAALDDAFKEYMTTLAGKAPTVDEVHKLLIDTYKKKIAPDEVKDMKDDATANQALENAFGLRDTANKLVTNYQAVQKSRQKISAGTPRSFKAWLFSHVKQPQNDMAKTILAQVLSMRARSGSSVIFISEAIGKGQVEAIMLICAALNQLGVQVNCVDQRRGIEVKDRVLLYEIPQDQAKNYAEFMKKNFNDVLERLEPEKPEHAADASATATSSATSSSSASTATASATASASSSASSSVPVPSSSSASSSVPLPSSSSASSSTVVDPTATASPTKTPEAIDDETVLADTVLAKTKVKTPTGTPLPLSASVPLSDDEEHKYERAHEDTDSSNEIVSPDGVDIVITHKRNGFGSSH